MEDSQVAAALSAQLAERIGAKRFKLWFTTQAQIHVCGAALTIRTVNAFVRDWLRAQFADEIADCWMAMKGEAARLEFCHDVTMAAASSRVEQLAAAQPTTELAVASKKYQELPSVAADAAVPAGPSGRRWNAGLTGFIVGRSNEYAFRAAELTARGRQQASPLLLVGPSGVGKTHLLRAIQQEYRRHHSRDAVLYLTAEQFTTNFVEALRGSGMPSFRQKCRGAQLLAIDDLQFFPGKKRTLEELLYTLDAFAADGKQVVLASDRGLTELRALGPELISRLSGGLICEIAPPGFATRLGMVRQFAAEAGFALTEDVARMVATQINAGARELRGALHRLKAMSDAYGEPMSMQLAERALDDLARHCTRTVRLADVQKVVCEAFGVEAAQLRSDRKGRSLAEPRMLAMWLARKYTRAPWSEIGQFFGRHSHSTVISAHKRVEKLIAEQGNVGLANQTCQVEDAIRALETALRSA
jgi:chromosomal replication initiator protein